MTPLNEAPCSMHFALLNVYFWLVVEGARKEWLENREILTTNIQQTSENVINEVVVKSPSYVSTTLMANQQFASRRINDLPSYDSLENVT
ncbi:hypothetical protein M0802_001270 [Mischocyttarus mexicanus]|nr:hypothetical protein M0802_001270 [Mischocyttarus mexicanus]